MIPVSALRVREDRVPSLQPLLMTDSRQSLANEHLLQWRQM